MKFKELFEAQVRKLINELMITTLIDYLDVNPIIIKGSDSEYINVRIPSIDKNLAIWNLLGTSKVVKLNRYSSAYYPYFQLYDSLINFQLSQFKTYGSLFNIYDENFGGIDNDGKSISATGLWAEVEGNVISSLFCKENDIELSCEYSTSIDYKKLLIQYLDIESCIVTNENTDYISKINKNVNEYTLEKYATYLLENFYSFDNVVNESGNRIKYTVDKKTNTVLNFTETKIPAELTFIFKRK